MKMEYFGIRVTDLERSVEFYTNMLGLKEVRRGDMAKHNRGIWVLLKDEKTVQPLELDWYPPNSPFSTHHEVGDGVDHIGFMVDDARGHSKNWLEKKQNLSKSRRTRLRVGKRS